MPMNIKDISLLYYSHTYIWVYAYATANFYNQFHK
jgi:hypothetical protein